jgi:serpin B
MNQSYYCRLLFLLSFLLLISTTGVAAQSDLPDEVGELVAGNNTFAFDLYQAIAKVDNQSIIYSPYSISQALAMIYAGAGADTETQMAQTLHFMLPQDDLHPAFSALDFDLNNRDSQADEPTFRLNIVNALWGQVGYPFNDDYLETLESNYGAGLQTLDFGTEAEEARLMINDWVAEATEERILDVVPEGVITANTRLVLANAIYFNASWLNPFFERATEDDTFTLLDGEQVTVPMMRQQSQFAYLQGVGYQAVDLPYLDRQMAMLIILPEDGNFEEFESGLNAELFNETVDTMSSTTVSLAMPKFEYEFDLPLNSALTEMGMVDAFDEAKANFSAMANLGAARENLFISDVLHKAFIKVDENGTEAAAATLGMMSATSMPVEIIELELNRPFLFAIYDKQTNTILFIGRMMNPAD